jgi:hypothetical protein
MPELRKQHCQPREFDQHTPNVKQNNTSLFSLKPHPLFSTSAL